MGERVDRGRDRPASGWKRLSWVAALCVLALAPGCRRDRPGGRPKPTQQDQQPERLQAEGETRGLNLIMDDPQGRRLWEIKTDRSRQDLSAAEATLTRSEVILYDKGKPDIMLNAPEMKVDGIERKLTMWGGITAKSSQRDLTFRVDRLVWDANTKRFTGTGGVRLQQGAVSMSADRLSGRTPLNTVDLEQNVRFEIGGTKP